jgi:hypothetical protein
MKTTMKKIVSAAAALAVGLGVAGSAGGAGAATWSIQIQGIVPLLCNVDLNGVDQVTPGEDKSKIHLGQMKEFCNSGTGYTVFATTPAGTGGAFVVNGQVVPVQAGGVTQLDMSSTAAIEKKSLDYEPQGGQAPATISLSIMAR